MVRRLPPPNGAKAVLGQSGAEILISLEHFLNFGRYLVPGRYSTYTGNLATRTFTNEVQVKSGHA